MKKVILMCGTGASSSFMASKTRKALLSRNVDIEISARSDSELEDVMKTADLILIGPHLKFIKEEMAKLDSIAQALVSDSEKNKNLIK